VLSPFHPTLLPARLPPTPHPSLQTQKSFQKQANVSLGFKKLATTSTKKLLQGGQLRYSRSVGLGFKTPAEAVKVSGWLSSAEAWAGRWVPAVPGAPSQGARTRARQPSTPPLTPPASFPTYPATTTTSRAPMWTRSAPSLATLASVGAS
jgi:hypothetical protein